MEQITITREEFKERIVDNPKSYGVVHMLRQHPEMAKGRELMSALEEITTMIILSEIESELFGDGEEQKTEPAVPDLPFA